VKKRGDSSEVLHHDEDYARIKIGKVPIMVRSNYCKLHESETDENRIVLGECVYDQGGYFIVNGGEKVIVAQEKMADNFVYVFKAKPPSKHSWVAEIRSSQENSSDPPRSFKVKLKSSGQDGTTSSAD
jgi:DNA-directed RNA polymerase II subunit RPB2